MLPLSLVANPGLPGLALFLRYFSRFFALIRVLRGVTRDLDPATSRAVTARGACAHQCAAGQSRRNRFGYNCCGPPNRASCSHC